MLDDYISVLVLCYNSENTIIETLESIKNQTYKNLDLFINDDASKDNSVKRIDEWIANNRKRFRKIRFLKNEENKGINASFDKLLKLCHTKWAKFFAGDDIMLPICIEHSYRFVQEQNIDTLLYSKVIPFRTEGKTVIHEQNDWYDVKYAKKIASLNAWEQYKHLLKKDILFSPTGFINVDRYKELGGISGKIKNIEDWPLRLLFTSNGSRIYFMDEVTVLYRIGDSVSHRTNQMYNIRHIKQIQKLKRYLVYPNIKRTNITYYFSEAAEQFRFFIIIKFCKNYANVGTKFLNGILMIFEINKIPERVIKTIYKFKQTKIRDRGI